ncbi:MAG: HAMP domain-containing protein [Betaproteobacteria bacterium]|nr:HAMP domain-containing protein [Betaproteobacteria bacterium]
MKVWQKIMVAPGVAMLFLATLGGVSYWALTIQQHALQDVYNNRFASYQAASHAAQAFSEVHANVYRLFTRVAKLQPDKLTELANEQRRHIAGLKETISKLAQRPDVGEEERNAIEGVVRKLVLYSQHVETAIDLTQVDPASGVSAMQRGDTAFMGVIKDLKQVVEAEKELAQVAYASAGRAYDKVVYALVGILILALLISAAIAIFMSRVIVRPLVTATALAGRIAQGDLTGDIQARGKDEIGQLLRALKDMSDSLRHIVENVRSSAEAIGTGTGQIASGNADLSQHIEEQASSLEETASSMEELTSTVKQNAENAKQANQLAIGASEIAVKGGEVVSEVVGTMSSINESSKKIVDIISVIDGIAFQTNILALNAAVEAARAGEQGRGFAVVATEVRNLAQRSAAAAKEIKALIGDSVEKVGTGTKLVDAAGKTMEKIVASVKRVTDIMGEITAASQEQSSGIEQVNRAITQMDEMTQQNAALVEEAASAAESLQEQAQTMEAAVAVFTVGQASAHGCESAHSVPAASGEVVHMASARSAKKHEARKLSLVAAGTGKKAEAAAAVSATAPRAKIAAGSGEGSGKDF